MQRTETRLLPSPVARGPAAGIAALALALGSFAGAQSIELIRDVNNLPVATRSSDPAGFSSSNGKSYFVANGSEIHEFDLSTRAVTRILQLGPSAVIGELVNDATGRVFFTVGNDLRVLDVARGTALHLRSFVDEPLDLVAHVELGRRIVYFTADDGVTGRELWKSDGTIGGTVWVADIRAGANGSDPHDLVPLFGRGVSDPDYLCFIAHDGLHGPELWRTDGSPAGVQRLTDFRGTGSTSGPRHLTASESRTSLYFSGTSVLQGREPWRSDGTTGGTRLLVDLVPGTTSSYPSQFLDTVGFLYLTANTAAHGWELWAVQGSSGQLVKDIATGAAGSNPLDLTPGPFGDVYFSADDGRNGRELWRSDGTATGTTLVMNIARGSASSDPEEIRYWDRNILFTATDTVTGRNLWILPRAASAPSRLTLSQNGEADPEHLTPVYGAGAPRLVLFAAYDDAHGREPWITDGTANGTEMVTDINRAAAGPETLHSNPDGASSFGDFYFAADDGRSGPELWKTDGTAAGTLRVADLQSGPDGSFPGDFVAAGRKLFFLTRTSPSSSVNKQLWVIDGPTSAPRRIGSTLVRPLFLTAVGERIYFAAAHPTLGQELHVADATGGGSIRVLDLRPRGASSIPRYLAAYRGLLYFAADDGQHGYELWRSDGTTGGTTRVKDIAPGAPGSSPARLTVVHDTLFFSAASSGTNTELWKSDGTTFGTRLVKDIVPGVTGSHPSYLTAVGDRLFFVARDGSGPNGKLFRSDGTAAGTVRVGNIAATRLLAVGDLVVFNGFDSAAGNEPWRSDGTAAGTFRLRDIASGTRSGGFHDAFASGSRFAWFEADDGTTGRELWRTDGTRGGTRRVADLDPNGSSTPEPFGLVHGRLVLAATHPVYGRELFRVDPGACARPYGQGFGAPGEVLPTLTMNDPVLGGVVTLRGRAVHNGTLSIPVASVPPAAPVDIGHGCVLCIDPTGFVVFDPALVTNRTWSLSVPIPPLAGWVGIEFAWQAIVGSSGTALRFDVTNGVLSTFGY